MRLAFGTLLSITMLTDCFPRSLVAHRSSSAGKSLLAALPKQDWRAYRKRYLRLYQHRRVAQQEQRKRDVAQARYGGQVVDGAEGLVKISIASTSSSSPASVDETFCSLPAHHRSSSRAPPSTRKSFGRYFCTLIF